jgi:hypothetical protein
MKKIRTQHWLPYSQAELWSVLVDFDSYEEWNPLNIKAQGKAAPGARIPMTFINPARPGATVSQTVTITACLPGKELAWRGYIPLLFKGDHFFKLAPEGEGTRLLHGENASGLVPMTFSRTLLTRNFVPAYEAMNRAVADRLAIVFGNRQQTGS